MTFSLIIGADLLPTLSSWRFSSRLLAEVPFLCVPRPGYSLPPSACATATATSACSSAVASATAASVCATTAPSVASSEPVPEAPALPSFVSQTAPAMPVAVAPRFLALVTRSDGSPLPSLQLSSTAVRRLLSQAHVAGEGPALRAAAGLIAPQVLAYAIASSCYEPPPGAPPAFISKSSSELVIASIVPANSGLQ